MAASITIRDAKVNTYRVRPESHIVNNAAMAFPDNLKRLRKAAGFTQEALALACGWSGQSRIANYEKGIREPNFDETAALASALGVNTSDLIGRPTTLPVASDWSDIQGYAQTVGLGRGAESQEYAGTHKVWFRTDTLRLKRLRPGKLAVMYGDGDSMAPRIRSGDAILFDTSDTRVRDGKLYVITFHGAANPEYQVKRAMLLDGSVFFAADNPTGDHGWTKPRRADPVRGHIEVIGRVRWVGSWED